MNDTVKSEEGEGDDIDSLPAPEGNIVGSVVALKSGGPIMTVSSVNGTMCNCKWYHYTELKHVEAEFFRSELMIYWSDNMSVEILIQLREVQST